MQRLSLAVLVAALFSPALFAQDEEENPALKLSATPQTVKLALNTVDKAVDLGLVDGRKAVGQITLLLQHKDEATAIRAANTLTKIGGKLKDAGGDDAKRLRLVAATGMVKAADDDAKDRAELKKVADENVKKFTTDEERTDIRAKLKKK